MNPNQFYCTKCGVSWSSGPVACTCAGETRWAWLILDHQGKLECTYLDEDGHLSFSADATRLLPGWLRNG